MPLSNTALDFTVIGRKSKDSINLELHFQVWKIETSCKLT